MAKIVVPRNGCLAAKKAKIVAPYSSDYYRKLVEEADARIREARTREARVFTRRKNYRLVNKSSGLIPELICCLKGALRSCSACRIPSQKLGIRLLVTDSHSFGETSPSITSLTNVLFELRPGISAVAR